MPEKGYCIMAFVWDDSAIARLRELRSLGTPPAAIAEELGGISRNAVIGKMFRLGMTAPSTVNSGSIAQRLGCKRHAAKKKAGAEPTLTPKPTPVAHIPRDDLPMPVAKISFAELDRDSCRFPVGDPGQTGFGFCGDPTIRGRPYCPTCTQRALKEAS